MRETFLCCLVDANGFSKKNSFLNFILNTNSFCCCGICWRSTLHIFFALFLHIYTQSHNLRYAQQFESTLFRSGFIVTVLLLTFFFFIYFPFIFECVYSLHILTSFLLLLMLYFHPFAKNYYSI